MILSVLKMIRGVHSNLEKSLKEIIHWEGVVMNRDDGEGIWS